MALIALDHVSKVYPKGTRPALDDVNAAQAVLDKEKQEAEQKKMAFWISSSAFPTLNSAAFTATRTHPTTPIQPFRRDAKPQTVLSYGKASQQRMKGCIGASKRLANRSRKASQKPKK